MKIKEILDRLDYEEWEVELYKVPITWTELYDIRDYITNLQQENERLKRKLTTKKLFKKYKVQTPENFEIRKIFELQRRIEKAVEYLKEHSSNGEQFMEWFECTELMNILNGRSDE